MAARGSSTPASSRIGKRAGARSAVSTLPVIEPIVPAIDGLEEICDWLGTYRERLRLAHRDDSAYMTFMVPRLKASSPHRRAGLS